jgi:EAL domain-containing protein (putative c-di-GMP-specific phosphodiesterase class I)
MGHALNYKIIAEGAERKEEVQLLQTMGCDVVQGYYFSKPLSELKLLEFMQKCETGGGSPLDSF